MTVELWTYLLVILSFGGYLYIGYMNRVRDTKGFYVAGQGVPAVANGAATAADWMSAASFIGMAGLISFLGYDGSIYLMGWTGGYVLLAMLLAPYLRKFGKYTVPDFVGDRYYSNTARSVAAICAIFVSFTYVAGQMRGVGIVFSRFLGVEVWLGVTIGMIIVAFFAILGGMKGITWTQVAQYCVLIFAYLLPAIFISLSVTGWPVPQLGFTFGSFTNQLSNLQVELGLNNYIQPFAGKTMIDVFFITVALMIGTAGLPHVIVRFYTVPNVRAARYSAFWALVFIGLLYTTAPAIAVFAKYNLLNSLHGIEREADGSLPRDADGMLQVQNPNPPSEGVEPYSQEDLAWVGKWEAPGLLKFTEDKNGDGMINFAPGNAFEGGKPSKEQMAEPLPAGSADSDNEVYIDRDIIVLSTPEVAGLPAIVVALTAAGGLAAALSTASGLLLVISSSFSHDIYYRLINPNAAEGQRLLVGRVVIAFAVIIAGLFGIYPPAFVAQVVAFAFGLAASSFFPVIILGIFDKRTNNIGAIAGMSVGIIFTAGFIIIDKFISPGTLPPIFFGISSEGIGTLGAILNFIVTFGVSRATEAPPQEIQDLVESVRMPKGAGTASTH
jgi:cation/acetate symporter